MNPTEHSVFLPANAIIASASSIQPESIHSLNQNDTDKSRQFNNTKTPIDEQIDFDFSESDLSNEQKQILQTFLNRYRHTFATSLDELGHTHLYTHAIDTGNALPIRKRFYRQSPQVLKEMNKQIDEMLHHGIIKESNSNWASPVVMCKKKGGQLRFCCDFRLLNNVSRPNFFPLPSLEDVFDSLGNAEASIFSTLDMMNGYWQIGMDPETAHKAAFVTPGGVYQWTRMPFGIASAPASFQHLLTQEYPQHTDTAEEPEDVIPHVQLNAVQERHEPLETTFMYNGYPTKPKQSMEVITTDPGEDIMPQDIGKLQKDCPDFKDIYAYLHNGKIPDNKDKIQKTLAESNQYGLRDGVLYHFYQPRSRGMYQKLADFIKHCDLCQRSKQPTHAKRVPLTSMPIMDTFSKLHIDMIGPFKKTNQGLKGSLTNLKIAKEIATENIKKAQIRQKQHYDKKTALPTFQIGDKVLLHSPKVPIGHSSKLHRKWTGPFYITAKGLNHTYKLRRSNNHIIMQSMINANRLKPYNDPRNCPDPNPPPPDIPAIDRPAEVLPNFQDQQSQNTQNITYEVEQIIKMKRINNIKHYRIKRKAILKEHGNLSQIFQKILLPIFIFDTHIKAQNAKTRATHASSRIRW
ncbi:unnamed protein product [Mytilus coruscus]|uniref:Uncharacterized protein n=1 Tax=Mytilus coruscus TaxID=42192 RepID=A0A6J8CQJ7_MYTCO|nr:unnamed protein product [Mytilus coruscus]